MPYTNRTYHHPPARPPMHLHHLPLYDIPPSLRSCPIPIVRLVRHKQSGRHRRNDAPYAKPINDDRGEASRPLASRMGGRGGRINPNAHPGRLPVGAPITIDIRPEHREAQKAAQAKLSEKLSSEEMKNWLRAHHIAEGVMDMSVSGWP